MRNEIFTGLDAIAFAFNFGHKARHLVAIKHIRNVSIDVESHDGDELMILLNQAKSIGCYRSANK